MHFCREAIAFVLLIGSADMLGMRRQRNSLSTRSGTHRRNRTESISLAAFILPDRKEV